MLMGIAIYPPMVQGGFPPPAQSIGIVSALEGGLVEDGCVDVTADPAIVYTLIGKITAIGQRDSFKAHAYSQPGCTGMVSLASENTAYAYPGMSPDAPGLMALLRELLDEYGGSWTSSL
jgi:hypothetical protein